MAASPLPGVLPIAAVGEEVGADGAQVRAEPPPRRVRFCQQPLLQDAGEEVLGQIPIAKWDGFDQRICLAGYGGDFVVA